MNPLDIVAILLVVLAVLLGFRSGALPQIGGLLGAIAGGALAILGLPLVADLLGERFGKACVVREGLGPLTWIAKGADVALVAGPFTRKADRTVAASGTCATATAWAKAMIAAPAKR